MERILNYTISAADEGMIVLDFLRKQGFSRHILTAMKADREALSLNGQKAGGRTVLSCGDHFRVRLLETVPTDGILPTPLNIPVLYEDEDILVVNKPADMPGSSFPWQLYQHTCQRSCRLSGNKRRILSFSLYQPA